MKAFFSGLIILLGLISCTSKNKTVNEVAQSSDSTTVSLDGEYEYYAGAVDDGYLYHKLTLSVKGDDVTGTIFSGTYLSKNEEGYYTMPAATITANVTGHIGGKEVKLYLGTTIDSSRIDKTYMFPDLRKLFGEDANGDSVQPIYKSGNDFRWVNNGDTLVFSKTVITVK